jgi:RNA polymerase sigma factor (sigma-70 family)
MSQESAGERLSNISTAWTLLQQLHGGSPEQGKVALEMLLMRYRGAVHRYLRRAVGEEEAEDLAQEFGLALLRGEFRHADPQRGRFRDYVRTALFHLVYRHRRRQQKLPHTEADLEQLQVPAEAEQGFNTAWRDELLSRAWAALGQVQASWYEVLHFRAHHPEQSSTEMAFALEKQLGRPMTAEGVRQTLRRARKRFAELLLAEVTHSLQPGSPEQVEQELSELNLLSACQDALQRRRP